MTRENKMMYRASSFLAVVRFGSSPTPFPTLTDTEEDSETEQLVDGEGGGEGEELNHMTARKLSPLKSFNTLSD
jgi:hypothetical protein